MTYRVIYGFYDGQDADREYRAGDIYPRPGYAPDAARVAVLAGEDNVHGRPLIEPYAPPPSQSGSAATPRRSAGSLRGLVAPTSGATASIPDKTPAKKKVRKDA